MPAVFRVFIDFDWLIWSSNLCDRAAHKSELQVRVHLLGRPHWFTSDLEKSEEQNLQDIFRLHALFIIGIVNTGGYCTDAEDSLSLCARVSQGSETDCSAFSKHYWRFNNKTESVQTQGNLSNSLRTFITPSELFTCKRKKNKRASLKSFAV